MKLRTYIAEPDRGKRNWKARKAEKQAVYANRRRIRGQRGKRLQRRRGEKIERNFAHQFDTGGMDRLYVRGTGKCTQETAAAGGRVQSRFAHAVVLWSGQAQSRSGSGKRSCFRHSGAHGGHRKLSGSHGAPCMANAGATIARSLAVRFISWSTPKSSRLDTGC